MDLHDRRLSVSKSSSRISKPSSSAAAAPRPPSSSTSSSSASRPPTTLVSADLSNFRRVVQQLTGTSPPSASSSPLREVPTSRPSRLHRFAPPPLRDALRPSSAHLQNQQPLHHHYQHGSHPPLLHQQQQGYSHHDTTINGVPEGETHQHPDFSWLASSGILSPLFPSTQTADSQNPGSKPAPYPPPNASPQLFSALPPLTPTDSMWAYTASPRPFSNSAGPLPPLLPLPSEHVRDPGSGSGHSLRNEAFQWSALSTQLGDGRGVLHLPSNGSPLLPSTAHAPPLLPLSSSENPPPSSSGKEHSLLGPSPTGLYPHFPPSPASLPPLLPLSPSTASFNPWLHPWPPSPFMTLPFSPGLFPSWPC